MMSRSFGLLHVTFVVTSLVFGLRTNAHADEPAALPPLPPLSSEAAQAARPPAPQTPDPNAADETLTPYPPRRPERYQVRPEISASGGVVLRSLFSVPLYMGGGEVGVGARLSERFAFHAAFDYEVGSTRHGLSTNVAEGACLFEGVWDRFRVGAGPGLLRFSLTRATNGSALWHFGVAARVITSFDIIQSDTVAVYLAARGEADWMFAGTLLGAGVNLGFRFNTQ